MRHLINRTLDWATTKTNTNVRYAAHGTFWWGLGKASSALASIAIMLAFAHFVPKETFGAYKYVLSLVGIFTIFTLPGLNSAVVRAIARGREGMLRLAAREKNTWAVVGMLGLIGVATYYYIQGNAVLGGGFLIASLFLPLKRTTEMFSLLWHGRMHFKIQSLFELMGNVLPAGAIVASVFLTDNLLVILAVYFGSYTLIRGIAFLYSLTKTRTDEVDTETITLGKHLTLMQAAGKIAGQIDKVLLWHLLGPVTLAIFAFAQMPIQQAKEIIPVQALALPKLATREGVDRKTVWRHMLVITLVTTLATIFVVVVLPLVYQYLFPQYVDSTRFAQVLALSILFVPFSYLTTKFISHNQTRQLYFVKIGIPVVKIILLAVLIPLFGIWGGIAGLVASEGLAALVTLILYLRYERK